MNKIASNMLQSIFDLHLDQQDKKDLAYLESIILSNNINEGLDKAIQLLSNSNCIFSIKILENSSQIREFCSSNAILQNELSKKLRKSGYVSLEIRSINGDEKLSILDIYIAALILNEHFDNLESARTSNERKNWCIKLLDLASEIGLYNALLIRCKKNTKTIVNQQTLESDRNKAMDAVINDTKRLSNLYWGIGYVQAACLLQIPANYFLQIKKERKRGILLYEEAIKNFLCASFLEGNSYSNQIIDNMTLGKGILSAFNENGHDVETWDEAKEIIRGWVEDDVYERIYVLAEEEIMNESK